ncbi:MAG: hypothetical protein M3Q07_16050 [Pseudobdellovibrionaceae bacterium]|nr:hypothetical protein [Pseudobdellovibrionaceae bacterium]
MLIQWLGIPLGLLYCNAGEWFIHKYVLHNLGKSKTSLWAFHWHEHHRLVMKKGFSDPGYQRSVFGWHAQGKETLGLAVLGLVHLPLLPVAPVFVGTVLYSIFNYYRVHKKAHQDYDWAQKHLPWHVEHHMGRNQNLNWCVTKPWFDQILGTSTYKNAGEIKTSPAHRKIKSI